MTSLSDMNEPDPRQQFTQPTIADNPTAPPRTFRSRLEAMQRDLVAMAHELNKSDYWDAAMRVQQVLIGIDHIYGADADLDDPDDWRWPPEILPMDEP